MNEDRFKSAVINTLAKRAANICSNPDCGAITSGPADDPQQSVSVGEAAHIYGAHQGSARYEPTMLSEARSDITNAVWLCRNCHKMVDDDESRFPAGLLFEWRREHERHMAERLGKAGSLARDRYIERHLGEFSGLSYLAEQIVIDKPPHWEYKLTAEVLRIKAGPVLKRWGFLKKKLYSKPVVVIPLSEVMAWLQARHSELSSIVGALGVLVREEFQRAWGEPGLPGSDIEIVAVCGLFADACLSVLEWEESVRFVQLPPEFEGVRELLIGIGGAQLDEVAKIPAYLTELVSGEPMPGEHKLVLTFAFPPDWAERYSAALERAVAEAFS